METTETATPISQQYTLGRLFRRAWTILFKEPWGKGRISRGEYWITSMVLSLLGSLVVLILAYLPPVFSWLVILVGLGQFSLSLGYIKKRCHDLGKTSWYFGLPFTVFFGLFLLGFLILFYVNGMHYMAVGSGLPILQAGRRGIGVLVIFLVLFIWLLVVILNLAFATGNKGANSYGVDPLLRQPAGNGLYRGLAIGLIVVSMLVSTITPKNPGMWENSMRDYLQQNELGDENLFGGADLPEDALLSVENQPLPDALVDGESE